jgi:hypothetical protein
METEIKMGMAGYERCHIDEGWPWEETEEEELWEDRNRWSS